MPQIRSFFEDVSPDGTTTTIPCFTCAHCSLVVAVPKRDSPMGFCMRCFRPTCTKPECSGDKCEPFEIKIKKMESRARFLAQVVG
jgi:hypothetical protein